MGILDTIIDNHGNGARIISEEHNLNNVTIEAAAIESAMAGLGRVWDAAEMGITREQAEQMMRDAQTPEARERVLTNLRTRAIRRAQLDRSNGRVSMMSANKPAWHGLGVVVDRATTSAEALHLANLDWKVKKVENSYEWNGVRHVNKESYTIVREDTGRALGTVGTRYAPIQNVDGFAFIDGVLSEFDARYETAGSLYGGRRVWMLVNLPKASFTVGENDRTEAYGLFSNCHDGSGSAWFFPTTVRVECANTQRIAMQGRGGDAFRINHTGDVKSKIQAAKMALGYASEAIADYREKAQAMVNVRVNVRDYAAAVLDKALGLGEDAARLGADALADAMEMTEAEKKVFETKLEKRNTMLEDILDRAESQRCNPRGTLWGAFNAVTEHADHAKRGREASDLETRQSRRFESIINGDADTLKQYAYAQATAALG